MIPINPITIFLNGFIRQNAVDNFFERNLPAYDRITTSVYRNPVKNKEVDGAPDSAHQYNLAEDFVLINKSTREKIPEAKARIVFDEFIKPAWKGYTEFEPSTETEGYHIHANLDRSLSKAMSLLGFTAVTVGGIYLYKSGAIKELLKK